MAFNSTVYDACFEKACVQLGKGVVFFGGIQQCNIFVLVGLNNTKYFAFDGFQPLQELLFGECQ